MFERSPKQNGVRCTIHRGDGDSNAFKTVADSMPYGENILIERLECIGHVQKRMGARLPKLRDTTKQTERKTLEEVKHYQVKVDLHKRNRFYTKLLLMVW